MGTIIEIIFLIVLGLLFLVNIIFLMFTNMLKGEDRKLSGFEVARILSDDLFEDKPHIIKKKGKMLDHYNPKRNTIKLNPEVFDGTNLYSTSCAVFVTIEADPKRKNTQRIHSIADFLIMASYIIIIMGSFLTNAPIIHFGMIIFIASVILEWFNKSPLVMKGEEEKIVENLIKLNIIKNNKEDIGAVTSYSLISLANLPYRFINLFR